MLHLARSNIGRAKQRRTFIDGNKSLTYAAWNDRADRLAHSLTRLGVEAGDIVVARLQIRSEWAVINAALVSSAASSWG